MNEVNTDQWAAARQLFGDAFDDASILEFAKEFACMVNGQTTNIYKLADGIHIGIQSSHLEDVSQKEIMTIFSSAAKEFVCMRTNDEELAKYVADNMPSLIKILFIDSGNFTIII